MKVTVENHGKPVVTMFLTDFDTVYSIKEKIQRCLGFPVARQTLFFNGILLNDHLDVAQYQIVNNSCLELFVSSDNPNRNNNQIRHQTQQSPAPSNSTQQTIHGHQDWPPVTVQTEQSPVPSISTEDLLGQDLSMTTQDMQSFSSSNVQDSSVMVRSNNNQVLQTEQVPVMSAPIQEVMNNNEEVLSWLEPSNESQSLSDQIEAFLNQDFHPVTVESSRNNESSLPSYTMDELFGDQDWLPVTVGSRRNRNQVAQTEKSPVASDSAIEVINITGSPVKKKIKTGPVKLTVRVKPYEENRTILMEFNPGDKVEELRKEVVKMHKRGQLNLPQPFFFIHKQTALTETESFYCNLVAHGDLIEIWIGEIL